MKNKLSILTSIIIFIGLYSQATAAPPAGLSSLSYTLKKCSDISRSSCTNTVYNDDTNFSMSAEGVYDLIVSATDNAGYSKTETFTYYIDKTPPSSVGISGISTTWVQSDTVNITCSDTLSGCDSSTYQYRVSNSNFSCDPGGTWISGTSYLANSNQYICARVKDNLGNVYSYSSTYNINRVDAINPTGNTVYSNTAWTNGNVTVTITCADTQSGCDMSYNNPLWSKSGNDYIRIFTSNSSGNISIRDNAGNMGTVTYSISNIDTNNPVVSATNSSNLWVNSNISINLSASDTGVSSLAQARYSWTNSLNVSCTSGGIVYTNGTNIIKSSNGAQTLYLCARDNAGNTGVWNGIYRLDKIIPTITDDYAYDNVWHNVGSTITITPADAVPSSGINTTKYCWGSSCNPSSGTVGTSIPATGQIDNTLRYQTWDVAGNASAIGSIAVKVDTTNPTISANNSSPIIWRSNMVMNITLSAADSGGSGVNYRKYSWDSDDATCRASGTTFSDGQNITSATIPGNDQGTHTLYLCTRDIAGNDNQWNGIYKFDDDNPTVSDNYIPDNIWTNIGTTITLTPVDPNASSANSISLIQSTGYCWGSSCNPSSGTIGTTIPVGPDVDNTLRYQTWDNAGNASVIESIIVKIEDKVPDTTMSFNESGSATVYSPDSRVNYDVRGVINCSDILSASNSGCDNSTRQYRVQTSTFTCNTSGTWNNYNGTGIALNETIGNESVRYICSRVRDIATNGYVYSPVYTVRIDKDTPDFSDLTNTLPVPITGSKLLANVHVSSVTAVRDGGSPISMIEGYFEDSSTPSSYGGLLQSTSDNDAGNSELLTISADMTNVDLDRHADGYRQYSFKITKVEDEAGNIITDPLAGVGLPHILYYVFANTSTISDSDGASFAKNDVTINQLDVNYIADGENRLLRLELEDRYGNVIIPAADINREIDFRFNVTNNLKLDQYSTSPSDGVFLDRPSTPGVFSDLLSTTTTLTDETSSNGIYDYDFQVYTPTFLSGATDGRQWANGDMTIHDIDYIIRQTASSYIAATDSGSVVFDGGKSEIPFVFKPLYLAEFTGDLSLGIFADTVQSAEITVTTATGATVAGTSSSLRLGFGQTNGSSNNIAHPNYDLIYQPNSLAIRITEGHQTTVGPLQDLGTLSSSKNFDVKISHVSGSVNTSLPTYVSSHVRYTLNSHIVSYDTNTVGKTRYVDGTNLINTNQVGLKVLGRIQSKTQADITTGQSGTDLYAVGDNSKSGLRELIRKQAILETKNISGATAGSVTNITGPTWSNPNGTRLRNNTILYYDVTGSVNKIIEIGSAGDLVAEGVKTIIIKGGNAYIKGNITYSNKSTDMLGVVVLSDDAGTGGNLYLDPSVTHLAGIYYSDKALMSYTTVDGEIDGSVGTTILKDQFYLYGTLFSENTIGGSIIPKCPYYVSVTCDLNEARKYDLNFLRRYFTYDNNDPDTLKNNVYNAGNSYFSYGDDNFDYPMVIEYNPNTQTITPPLFENEKF